MLQVHNCAAKKVMIKVIFTMIDDYTTKHRVLATEESLDFVDDLYCVRHSQLLSY